MRPEGICNTEEHNNLQVSDFRKQLVLPDWHGRQQVLQDLPPQGHNNTSAALHGNSKGKGKGNSPHSLKKFSLNTLQDSDVTPVVVYHTHFRKSFGAQTQI